MNIAIEIINIYAYNYHFLNIYANFYCILYILGLYYLSERRLMYFNLPQTKVYHNSFIKNQFIKERRGT